MWIIPLLISLLFSPVASAQAKDKQDHVENMLDRLERRLLDEEALDLNMTDRAPARTTKAEKSPRSPRQPKTKTQAFRREKILGTTSELAGIQGIGQLVTQLESQIDQFAQAVQKSSQTIIEEAKIDNYIEIEARLADPDAAAISTLVVKLDGFAIYQSQDSAGLWLPSAAIPLYSGPFPPGTHRLDVEMRLAKRFQTPLPINEDTYHFVNKTFEIVVPIAKEKRHYIINITAQTGEGKSFDATLEDAT